jgi:GNAT superfamily N-acetyltransferase
MSDDWQIGSLAYGHRRAAYIEGNSLDTQGCYLISACRVFVGWGYLPDAAWPNATICSGAEPAGLDDVAKARRCSTYLRVDTIDEAKHCLTAWPTFGLQAAFPITHDWFYADGGRIELPAPGVPVIGTHVVDVVGFLAEEQRFRFWTPWPDWGNRCYGTMSADFFNASLKEAWSLHSVSPNFPSVRGYQCLYRRHRTPLGLSHAISLYNGGEDDVFAWAILLERENVLDLQDLFVKPSVRRKGHAAKLVQEIRRLRRARVGSHVSLVSSVHRIDAARFMVPIAKIACRLGLELCESTLPCFQYQAIPSTSAHARG